MRDDARPGGFRRSVPCRYSRSADAELTEPSVTDPPRPDPRAMLREIRALMVEDIGPQERLDGIVVRIATTMAADVSSVYVLRADRVLELYATRGLKPEAVHISQLALGEGLVGTIAATAEPLALAEAQSHPRLPLPA